MEALFTIPIGGTWDPVGHSPEEYEEEVHRKTHPDEQTGTTIPPHLTHHIVDDVTDGEHDQSCRHVRRAKGDLLGLQYVCRNQADTEQYAVEHKQHTDLLSFFFIFHFLVLLKGVFIDPYVFYNR